MRGVWVALASTLIAIWFLTPVVLITIAALTPSSEYYNRNQVFPRRFTIEHLYKLFVTLEAGKATLNSIKVALLTIALSFALGLPAGYALARYVFPGKNALRLIILMSRTFPLIIVAVPLLVVFMRFNLADTIMGVALAHTAMTLPFVILISSSILGGVSVEYEEAAMIFGLSRFQAFLRITLPLALPGLAASAIFAFIMSWNEVFVAAILTLQNRTLPAHILETAMASPDYFKFAAGLIMALPAMIFIFFTRRYLMTMWGISLK